MSCPSSKNAYVDGQGSQNAYVDGQASHFMKHDSGKPRFDLLPPEFLEETAQVLAYGAAKYSANNWAAGADWGRYFAAMMRHLWAWWRGEDADPETGLSHLAHAACCLAFLMAYQRRKLGRDDRQLISPAQADKPSGAGKIAEREESPSAGGWGAV